MRAPNPVTAALTASAGTPRSPAHTAARPKTIPSRTRTPASRSPPRRQATESGASIRKAHERTEEPAPAPKLSPPAEAVGSRSASRTDFDEPRRRDVSVERQRLEKAAAAHDREAGGVDEGVGTLVTAVEPAPRVVFCVLGTWMTSTDVERPMRRWAVRAAGWPSRRQRNVHSSPRTWFVERTGSLWLSHRVLASWWWRSFAGRCRRGWVLRGGPMLLAKLT